MITNSEESKKENMEDYNNEEKTPELMKIKIENLKKVSNEYNQKRQKTGNNDSTLQHRSPVWRQ